MDVTTDVNVKKGKKNLKKNQYFKISTLNDSHVSSTTTDGCRAYVANGPGGGYVCYTTPRPRFRLQSGFRPTRVHYENGIGGKDLHASVGGTRRHRYFFLDLRTNYRARSLCFARRHVSRSQARPCVIAPGFPQRVKDGQVGYTRLSPAVLRTRATKQHTLVRKVTGGNVSNAGAIY